MALRSLQRIIQSVQWRLFLLLGAIVIVGLSVWYTLNLAEQLKGEERKSMELLAAAQISMIEADPNCDITFQSKIIESNTKVPLLLVDGDYNILDAKNYDQEFPKDRKFFKKELEELKSQSQPILIESQKLPITNYIYFRQSRLITYLEWFPYLQFGLVLLFVLLAYLTFSSLRKAQQERVWVGMAKETAHQLGTPITSLLGWIENLKIMYPEDDNIQMISMEMQNDIDLLEIVAGRFSKIGAIPELQPANLYDRITYHYNYIIQRAPRKVNFDFPEVLPDQELWVNINILLFDWVIENLLKNALDAMGGKGQISLRVTQNERFAFIDVTDTGKGIPPRLHRKIFYPGFSTKKRGWGLGLSLCKRIIEKYHNGKIFVKESIVNQGTTFRIQIPKNKKRGQ